MTEKRLKSIDSLRQHGLLRLDVKEFCFNLQGFRHKAISIL
jgi:hypothetical protein